MSREDLDGGIRIAFEKVLAGRYGGDRINTRHAADMGHGALDGMMEHVAREHRVIPIRLQAHRTMSRRVPRRGLEPQCFIHGVVAVDSDGVAGLDHRQRTTTQ